MFYKKEIWSDICPFYASLESGEVWRANLFLPLGTDQYNQHIKYFYHRQFSKTAHFSKVNSTTYNKHNFCQVKQKAYSRLIQQVKIDMPICESLIFLFELEFKYNEMETLLRINSKYHEQFKCLYFSVDHNRLTLEWQLD